MLFLLFEVVFLLLGFHKLFGTKQVFYIGNTRGSQKVPRIMV